MRTITTLFLLLFSMTIFSQELEIKEFKTEHQKGYFIKVDGNWLRHGIWESEYGKAEYNNGSLVWIHPIGERKWTAEEIKAEQKRRNS